LDEATAHLDSESEAAIQRALATALAGRTSLVIAHRLSTVRAADQILVVDGGQITERGTHDELLAAGGVYAGLYRTQFAHQVALRPILEEGSHLLRHLGELPEDGLPAAGAARGVLQVPRDCPRRQRRERCPRRGRAPRYRAGLERPGGEVDAHLRLADIRLPRREARGRERAGGL